VRGENGGEDATTECVRTGGGRDCASLATGLTQLKNPITIIEFEKLQEREDMDNWRGGLYIFVFCEAGLVTRETVLLM